MVDHETPMIERYWRKIGGALFLEVPMTTRTPHNGARRLDGLIVPDLEPRIWRWSEAKAHGFTVDGIVRDRHVIAVQAKHSRLGMTVMGQAVFSVGLLERFGPASVQSVALVRADDAVLSPLLEPYPAVDVVVDDGVDAA